MCYTHPGHPEAPMPADNPPAPMRRCAIYTRKSVDLGLDRQFNSLEVQRTICSAYITSQGHKGWHEMPQHYDDAGRSGATLDRPELKVLLGDIEKGLIDIVIVYKLDRITRTLLDFVRLMDFFESHHVSFVSITQSFDTSESMGRLILNVLLTFAQFEREIFADRIRDKRRLINRSGRWSGGTVPLGYSVKKLILQINPREAYKVRFIFECFARCPNYTFVEGECHRCGIKPRRRKGGSRRTFHGGTISAASIRSILRNPVYMGLLKSPDGPIAGLHKPIIDRELWERVEQLRKERARDALLGKRRRNFFRKILHDCYGRMMVVHCGVKRISGRREYYASVQDDWCRRRGYKPFWIRRDGLDNLVRSSLVELFTDREAVRSGLLRIGCRDPSLSILSQRSEQAAQRIRDFNETNLDPVLRSLVATIEMARDRIQMIIRWREVERFLMWDGLGIYGVQTLDPHASETHLLDVPFSSPPKSCRPLTFAHLKRAPTSERSPRLMKVVHDARRAQALMDGNPGQKVGELARNFRLSDSGFMRLLAVNYLAPDIVSAILDGRQPDGLKAEELTRADLPLDWALQRQMLGFGRSAATSA